jgi:RsiW-degrading membrane proteinase PrsW (M82 family)
MYTLVRLPTRGWFQLLVSGLVFLALLDRAITTTQNLNYAPALLLIGAFLIPVTFVLWLYEHRWPDPPAPHVVVWCFVWGGVVGATIAGTLEYDTYRSLGILPLLAVGLIEELSKLLVPLVVYVLGRHRSEATGLLLGVASGMGFAALETMGYGFVAFLVSHGNLGLIETILLVRGLLSPAGHAAWTAEVTATLWRERAQTGHGLWRRATLRAFALAVVLHALWDTFQTLPVVSPAGWLLVEGLSAIIAFISIRLLVRRIRESFARSMGTVTAPHA